MEVGVLNVFEERGPVGSGFESHYCCVSAQTETLRGGPLVTARTRAGWGMYRRLPPSTTPTPPLPVTSCPLQYPLSFSFSSSSVPDHLYPIPPT